MIKQIDHNIPSMEIRSKFPEIITSNSSMIKILENINKISNLDNSILILGDSGTGKELISSAIHRLSNRSHNRLVAINCSAIPNDLLEAELFGYEKGAFTGADRKKIGLFEAGHKGTILLDEIGDMPLNLQAKILRVLQEKKFSPVGSTKIKKIDIRIIAATHRNLEKEIKNSKFRLDLYYRLNVFPIKIPSLKERKEDIPILLNYFLEKANRLYSSDKCVLSDEIIEVLTNYDWPGNIRQLENLVERLVIIKNEGVIKLEDLPEEFINVKKNQDIVNYNYLKKNINLNKITNYNLPINGINLKKFIRSIENNIILQALEKTNNNKNKAAKLLGLNRTTLIERIKRRNLNEILF